MSLFFVCYRLLADTAISVDLKNILPQAKADEPHFKLLLGLVFSVLAAATLLMAVIAGTKMAHSAGSPETVAEARNHLIFALVGFGLSLMSIAIVTFVLGRI